MRWRPFSAATLGFSEVRRSRARRRAADWAVGAATQHEHRALPPHEEAAYYRDRDGDWQVADDEGAGGAATLVCVRHGGGRQLSATSRATVESGGRRGLFARFGARLSWRARLGRARRSAPAMCENVVSYYAGLDASVLGGAALKSALHALVSPHTVVSYANAWNAPLPWMPIRRTPPKSSEYTRSPSRRGDGARCGHRLESRALVAQELRCRLLGTRFLRPACAVRRRLERHQRARQPVL